MTRVIRARASRDESGQILLFALVFLMAGIVLVTALLSLGMNGVKDTAALSAVLKTQYAADAALTEAMSALAYPSNKPLLPQNVSTAQSLQCLANSPGNFNPVTFTYGSGSTNTFTIYAECTYEPPVGYDPDVRDVEITACTLNVVPCVPTPAVPNAIPVMRVYVTLSHILSVDSNPITVTVDDWSVLYGNPS